MSGRADGAAVCADAARPGGYAARAADQQLRGATLPAARGEIYSADGTLLAASETCWTIRAAPREMADDAVEPLRGR